MRAWMGNLVIQLGICYRNSFKVSVTKIFSISGDPEALVH